MRTLIIAVAALLLTASGAWAVTVDGYCYLEGQQDHSGTKVKFIKVSPSAVTDSTYTLASGYFTKNVVPGIYDVEYSHAGYIVRPLTNLVLVSNTTLTSLSLEPVFAEIAGNLSGTLGPGNYHVNGNITVPAGQTLVINAGTWLRFLGHYKLNVYGNLHAVGTAADSIVFTRYYATDASRWWGIRFQDLSADSSRLEYCVVEFGSATGSGDNTYGGGVYCGYMCSPVISRSSIRNNTALNFGGGIYSGISSSPSIQFTEVCNNTANVGGGIFLTSATPSISYCTIRENTASSSGGGIDCEGGTPTVTECTISENRAGIGGGILCYGSMTVTQCTVVKNLASIQGGGVYCHYTSSIFENVVVAYSHGSGVYFAASPSAVFSYSLFFGNSAGAIENQSDGPPLLAQLYATNTNGDSSDIWLNIFEDPLFEDTANGDYSLLPGSPCIDAGDPELPRDPDSTIADIGATYFMQDLSVWPGALNFGSVPVMTSDTLTLTAYNRSSQEIWVYGLLSTDSEAFVAYGNDSDNVIAAHDSLFVRVVFSPQSPGGYAAELIISSDAPINNYLSVPLPGEGGITPPEVDDVVLQVVGSDAHVCWSPVDSSEYGTPITVDAYLVYFAEQFAGPYYFLGLTTDSCYIHEHVAQFASGMFYEVSAYLGNVQAVTQIVNEHESRLSRAELQAELASGLWRFSTEARAVIARRTRG